MAQITGCANPSKIILPILRTLWCKIVEPVTNWLNKLGVPKNTRIWWCPTAELCALPLHAAGPYKPKQMNLPDIYISSYTPTLSALIKARSSAAHESVVPKPKLLVIGQPGKTLPNVEKEISQIQKVGGFVDVLIGADANCDTVIHGLQQHSWVHFACHGHLDNQPFHSSSASKTAFLKLTPDV
jgi:CHAT domain-containing protein